MADPASNVKPAVSKPDFRSNMETKEPADPNKVLSPSNSKKGVAIDDNNLIDIKPAVPLQEGSSDSEEEIQRTDGEDPAIEGANLVERQSKAPTIGGPKKNCCYRFWNAIFRFFAHDSIYGSFVGPHPVSFLCCCIPCKSACKGTCKRPFLLASVATKTMWFIMLLIIMILSCLFIIPYPAEAGLEPIRDMFPCNDGESNGTTHFRPVWDDIKKDCSAHGGYFMVYRNFFAFCFLLFISSLIMINVKSTNYNRKRAKMHHGFWMYKYILLFILLLITYLGIRVEVGGIFEYIVSWIGLLSALLFSFAEITFLLDIVESYVVKNRASTSDWADCSYWTFVGVVLIFDIGVIGALCKFYSMNQYTTGMKEPKPEDEISALHVAVIAYAILMTILLIGVSIFNRIKGKFRYSGLLQTAFVISYLLGVVWNALGNSPDLQARPHYNPFDKSSITPQPGSEDIYFKAEECVHGFSAFFTLIYYVFWNGPRSKTAPLSILFDKIMYWKAKKPETPVIPSMEDAPEEYNAAIEELKVWDDEKTGVRYSWTMFYVFMILGSFSIMMAMCNFSDPWALQLYASSIPAFSIKILISFILCVTYIVTTTFPCKKIYPELFQVQPLTDALVEGGPTEQGQALDESEGMVPVPDATVEPVPLDGEGPAQDKPQDAVVIETKA